MKDPIAVELGRRGGLKGGKARALALSPQERRVIARRAARKRWDGVVERTCYDDLKDDARSDAKKIRDVVSLLADVSENLKSTRKGSRK